MGWTGLLFGRESGVIPWWETLLVGQYTTVQYNLGIVGHPCLKVELSYMYKVHT